MKVNSSDCEIRLRQVAAELLKSGAVALVIGYAQGSLPGRTRPVFLTKPEETACLVYNGDCRNNQDTNPYPSHAVTPKSILAFPG